MADSSATLNHPSSSAKDVELEVIVAQFEEVWSSGGQPEIEDFLGGWEGNRLSKLFTTLVVSDVRHKASRGIPCTYGEYLQRFPDHHEELDQAFGRTKTRIVDKTLHASPDDSLVEGEVSLAHVVSSVPRDERFQFGDYELLEVIARGGMGIVYKARQTKLNRTVALKRILAAEHANEKEIARFKAEAEAAARLDHPGIVPIYEIGEYHGQPYFSMGYVDGPSLADMIVDGPLPARRAAEILVNVAGAVHYAHCNGIVHRDLKPGNVLLDRDDLPRVTDFGLAKRFGDDSELTQSGQVLGTPAYMPPEQASGNLIDIGPEADVYSMGAVLYAILTGHPPFQAAGVIETLRHVTEREPVDPSQINPDIPKDLETICLKCLRKSSKNRYESAQDFADDLGRFLRDEPVLARPIGLFQRIGRWCKRNPPLALLAAATLLILVGSSVVSGYFAYSEMEQRHIAENKHRLASELELKERIARHHEARARSAAEQNDLQSQWNLYISRTQSLGSLWTERRFGEAKRLLDQSVPRGDEYDFRGWEWWFLKHEIQSASAHVAAYPAKALIGFRWLEDLNCLGICNVRSVQLLDPKTGQVQQDWALPAELIPASTCVWSNDGELLAFIVDSELRIHRMGEDDPLLSVRLFPDSKDPRRSRVEGSFISWSPDGMAIAVASRFGDLGIWDVASGEQVKELANSSEGRKAIFDLRWSPDGTRIAAGMEFGKVVVWDADSGEQQWRSGYGFAPVSRLRWSPDSRYIAAGAKSIFLLDRDGKNVWYPKSDAPEIRAIDWLDNDLFVSSDVAGLVTLWNATGSIANQAKQSKGSSIRRLALDRERATLFVASEDGEVERIALNDDSEKVYKRRVWNPHAPHVAMVPSGDSEAVRTVEIRNRDTGNLLATLGDLTYGSVRTMSWNHDGSKFAINGDFGELYVYDTSNWRLKFSNQVRGKYGWGHRWSRCGRFLAATSPEGVHVYDANNLHEEPWAVKLKEQATQLEFNADGSRLFALARKASGWIEMLDPVNMQRVSRRMVHHRVKKIAIDSQARVLAIGTELGEILLMDVDTAIIFHRLLGHVGAVESLAWAPDGKRLVSGGDRVRIWDTGTGREICTIKTRWAAVNHVQWSSDGRSLNVGGANSSQLWTIDPEVERSGLPPNLDGPVAHWIGSASGHGKIEGPYSESWELPGVNLKGLSEVCPDVPDVWFRLGMRYQQQGHFDNAALAFQEYTRLGGDQTHWLIHQCLMECYLYKGEFQRAFDHATIAWDYHPEWPDRDHGIHLQEIALLTALSQNWPRYDEMQIYMARRIKKHWLQHIDDDSIWTLAFALTTPSNPEDLELLEQYEREHRNDSATVAHFHFLKGDPQAALDVIPQSDTRASVLYQKALYLAKNGDTPSASKMLKTADGRHQSSESVFDGEHQAPSADVVEWMLSEILRAQVNQVISGDAY